MRYEFSDDDIQDKHIPDDPNQTLTLLREYHALREENKRLRETIAECYSLLRWLDTVDFDSIRQAYESAKFAINEG